MEISDPFVGAQHTRVKRLLIGSDFLTIELTEKDAGNALSFSTFHSAYFLFCMKDRTEVNAILFP